MSDYTYIVGGFFGLFVFILLLGPLGGADDIYGDEFVVIDSNDYSESELEDMEYDFDSDRIRYTPPEQFIDDPEPRINLLDDTIDDSEMVINDDDNLEWTGSENDHGFDYGYAAYDISNRENDIVVEYYNAIWFGNSLSVYKGAGEYNESAIATEQDESYRNFVDSPAEIDTQNCGSDEDKQCDWLELQLEDTDGYIETAGDKKDESISLVENDFFRTFNRFLGSAISALNEIVRMFFGYVEFTLAVPGILGTILRGYVTILIAAVVLKEGWIG